MDSHDLSLRDPTEQDWARIAVLADVALAHVDGAPQQHEWVANRRAFRGERVHLVAEREGVVAGYGAIERAPGEPEGRYRLFVVTSFADSIDVADALYDALQVELRQRHAHTVWLRELAGDDLLIGFAERRGFAVGAPYTFDGEEIVTLVKALAVE
jgi:hypothetical protein